MNKSDALAYIRTGLGAPLIASLEVTDADVETIAFNKALMEYFKRMPLQVHRDYQGGATITPENYPGGTKCLGVLNVNFTPASEFVDPSIDDPFGLSRRLIDLNIDHALPGVLAQRATITSLRRPSFSLTKDDVTGNIKLSSLYDGFFRITWGLLGDIEQVPPYKLYDVLDLAVAFLKIYIGETRALMTFPGPVQFDTAKLIEGGEKRKAEILARLIVIPGLLMWR